MIRLARVITLAVLVGASAGAGANAADNCLPPAVAAQAQRSETECRTLAIGDYQRTYRLFAANRADRTPRAVILVLHGGSGSGIGTEWLTLGRFHDVGRREGALIVYPDGFRNQWNDGRRDTAIEAHRLGIDDVGFLTALVDALAAEFPIDPGRVFAAGISNGGMMALRLACERAERFAAIAVVGAAFPVDLDCAPRRAVAAIVIAGTEDPLVPYGGGSIRGRQRGTVQSVQATVGFWVQHNECQEPPAAVEFADLDADDGTELLHSRWAPCRDGATVSFYAIKGGGHLWPGGRVYAGERLIGRASRELDATTAIVTFFSAHARPGSAR
ncbi:MAG: esterase [Alphaproteobacteria bacterium]|nr:esterase [Alphaproteobacteria bacterium]